MVTSQARHEQVSRACERGLSKRGTRELIEIARSGLGYVSVRAERDASRLRCLPTFPASRLLRVATAFLSGRGRSRGSFRTTSTVLRSFPDVLMA